MQLQMPEVQQIIKLRNLPLIQTTKGAIPLHYIIRYKASDSEMSLFCKILEDMRNTGVNLDTIDKSGEAPLHVACLNGCEKGAMWLIHHGVDINLTTKYVKT